MSDPPPSTSPPRAARADGLPGSIGRYEVRRRLGEGAMGRVLLAHDPVLDRDVAIKHLRDDLRIPRDVRDGLLVRMRHEARAAARVTHPNLVTLHDMGEDPAVGLYLVFEYVPGPTLKQRLEEEPLPPDEVATMARQLGEALTCAHAAGVLHRDVKPDNVILSRFGAKIADFGIARVPDSTLTHTGGLLGTPAYSAPETFRASTFSAASDQFSLAASLYEAASGRRAFPGDDSLSVTTRIANDPPDPIAGALGLPHVVDDVFGRALAKEPTARFPSCEAFGRALAAALVPVDALARSTSTPAPPAPAAPERRTGQILLGAAVVAVTLALVARTASRPAEPTMDAPAASVSAPPVASASSSGAPRRPPVAKPRPARAPAGTEPIASSAPRAESDAGAPATSAAVSASAMPDAPRP